MVAHKKKCKKGKVYNPMLGRCVKKNPMPDDKFFNVGSGHCMGRGYHGKGMHRGGRLKGFKKFVTKEGRKALKHAQTRTKKGTMANKLIKNVNKAVSGKAKDRRAGIYKLAEIALNQAAKASK